MKKRILSILLTVCMVICLVPTQAFADVVTHADHCVCGGSISAGNHKSHTNVTFQPWDGTSNITYTDGVACIYLTDDVEANLTLEEGQHLSLCLNGKKFTCADKTQPAITLKGTSEKNYSVLDICDCVGGGTLGGRTEGDKGGGAVHVYGKNSTFNLCGGKICGNSSVDGGAVSENTATGNGGAVYIYRTGSVCNLSGGTVKDNKANGSGGGIYINPNNNGQLNISGNPVVMSNNVSDKANNVYLPSGKMLTVNAMTDGAQVGITVEKTPTKTAPTIFGNEYNTDYSKYFYSDNAHYFPRYNAAKQLELAVITYTVNYLPGKNGVGEPITDLKEKDTAITLRDAFYTRDGYTQIGWATTDGGIKAYESGYIYTDNAPLTLYPVWSAHKYTVKFDSDGGTIIADKTDIIWSDKVLDGITDPKKDGWEFLGWSFGGITVTDDTTYSELAVSDTTMSLTLTALWKDIEKPSGTISVASDTWREFLNTVTFGLFFKNTQTVTVTADDNSGKPVKIEYLLSETVFKDREDIIGEWTELTANSNTAQFRIEPNKKAYVYVRLTDESNNSTVINSAGIVVYTDSEAITKKISTVIGSSDAVSFDVSLNGNTVSEIYNGSDLISAEQYTVSAEGKITLNGSYIKTLTAGKYTLTVRYNPLGETYVEAEGNAEPAATTVELEVTKKTASLELRSDLQKDYDGTPVNTLDYTTDSDGIVTVEYKLNGAADSAYTTAAPKDAGKYTVRVSVAESNVYLPASKTAVYTINPKEITIVGVKVEPSKIYDGSTAAKITYGGTPSVNYDGSNLIVAIGSAAYDSKNVGTDKTVTFTDFSLSGDAASNYRLKTQPVSVMADITAKTLTIDNVKVKNKSYDGTDTAQLDGSPTLNGAVEGDKVTLINGIPFFTAVGISENIPIRFTAFTLSGADSGNYTLTQPSNITASIKAYIADGSEYDVNSNDWINEDFVVTAKDGWQLSLTDAADGEWTDTLTVSQENNNGTLIFYLKRTADGVISEAVSEVYRIDKTAPVGEIRIDGRNGWQMFLNEISFGLFYKDRQTVTITAADNSNENVTVTYT